MILQTFHTPNLTFSITMYQTMYDSRCDWPVIHVSLFGKVIKVTSDDNVFAVKIINVSQYMKMQSLGQTDNPQEETSAGFALTNSTKVLKLLATWYNFDKTVYLMAYEYAFADVMDLIQVRNVRFPSTMIMKKDTCSRWWFGFIRQIVLGLIDLNAIGRVHLDISPENIMYVGPIEYKYLLTDMDPEKFRIGDLGLSVQISSFHQAGTAYCGGKLMYLAPELFCLTGVRDPSKVDVYSLGVTILHAMVNVQILPTAISHQAKFLNQYGLQNLIQYYQGKEQICCNVVFDTELLYLLQAMLTYHPDYRIGAKDILHACNCALNR